MRAKLQSLVQPLGESFLPMTLSINQANTMSVLILYQSPAISNFKGNPTRLVFSIHRGTNAVIVFGGLEKLVHVFKTVLLVVNCVILGIIKLVLFHGVFF